MLNPKAKRNLYRILPFGIIWLVFGLVFIMVEYAATNKFSYYTDGSIRLDYKVFIFAVLAVTSTGLLVGTIELLYLNQLFTRSSFTKKIVFKLLIYFVLLSCIIAMLYPIAASIELGTTIFDTRVWDRYINFLTSITYFSTNLQMAVSLGASLFYAEISDNLGYGVLANLFSGKYHTPKEEKRIFMFLDMKSSTTIAEKLGHINYFNLLKEYYYDLSGAIVKFSGEVYQYVGDEIVWSWTESNGVKNNNGIRCFYAMKTDLYKRKDRYHKNFGLSPNFKAGFHIGKVTTGEIGTIKKDIIFTGDVLNSAARIQALCNYYNVDILISDDLVKDLSKDPEFEFKSLGENQLRGRVEPMGLYTLKQGFF